MTFYENLVTATQRNFSQYYYFYAQGGSPYKMTKKKPLPYEEEIKLFAQKVKEADCVIVGGASGLSAAGGGDFYYEDNASYRKYFGKYAEKYGFKGAFAGTFAHWDSREEFWGYMATFLHTTQTVPVRKPYVDLDDILKGKDFFIITTNQDTQFLRLYPESKVAELQGDHRFFQCSRCCTDETWDAVKPVQEMIDAMGDGTSVPTELIHYQFEVIHPFLDGNGRTGRLISLIHLIDNGVISDMILPLSLVLYQNDNKYYHDLAVVEETGSYERFVLYWLKALVKAADLGLEVLY